jgi:hypothetical protein
VDVSYLFAALAVSDRDQAAAWYSRLIGRPPTFLPNDDEAVWQLAATASVYIVVDATRAGRGLVSMVVGDLGESMAEITARGISHGQVEVIAGAGRKCPVTDPDGNVVTLIEIAAPG